MPISYEPAGPYSASTSYAYGALAQANQDRDYALRQQSMDQQRELAMAGIRQQSLAQQQQAMNENARIQHQEYMASNAQAEQRMQREAMQRPSERDQWAAGQQQEMAQQHYGAQRQLQQEQMTQAESMRLQQLNAADAELEKLHTIDGTLDREGYLEGKARIRGLQGPLSAKMQRVQIQQKEEHAKLEHERTVTAAAHEKTRAELLAKGVKDRITVLDSGDTVLTHPDGKETVIKGTETVRFQREQQAREQWTNHIERVDKSVASAVDTWAKAQTKPPSAAEILRKTEDLREDALGREQIGTTFEKHVQDQRERAQGRSLDKVIDGQFPPRNPMEKRAAEIGASARDLPPEQRAAVHDIASKFVRREYQDMSDADLDKFGREAVKYRGLPSYVAEGILGYIKSRQSAKARTSADQQDKTQHQYVNPVGKF